MSGNPLLGLTREGLGLSEAAFLQRSNVRPRTGVLPDTCGGGAGCPQGIGREDDGNLDSGLRPW
jgi:hypothetical protein